ncbi:hypothetical protein GGI43DRAFT_233216 [Trichoderma evansii]
MLTRFIRFMIILSALSWLAVATILLFASTEEFLNIILEKRDYRVLSILVTFCGKSHHNKTYWCSLMACIAAFVELICGGIILTNSFYFYIPYAFRESNWVTMIHHEP